MNAASLGSNVCLLAGLLLTHGWRDCGAQVFLALDARGGYDSYHNLATGDGFAQWRGLMQAEGFELVARTSFTPESLVGIQALVLLQPYGLGAVYSGEEVSSISSFVARGGGLLVLAEGGTGSSSTLFDPVTLPFGVGFAATPSEALGAQVSGFIAHPLTLGVETIHLDYQRRVAVGGAAVDLSLAAGADDFLAVSGRAVFLGDSSVFMDPDGLSDASLASGSNAILAANVGRYLAAVPEGEATAVAAGLALLLWVGWRGRTRKPDLRSDLSPH